MQCLMLRSRFQCTVFPPIWSCDFPIKKSVSIEFHLGQDLKDTLNWWPCALVQKVLRLHKISGDMHLFLSIAYKDSLGNVTQFSKRMPNLDSYHSGRHSMSSALVRNTVLASLQSDTQEEKEERVDLIPSRSPRREDFLARFSMPVGSYLSGNMKETFLVASLLQFFLQNLQRICPDKTPNLNWDILEGLMRLLYAILVDLKIAFNTFVLSHSF